MKKGGKKSQSKSKLLIWLPRWPLVLSLAGDSRELSKFPGILSTGSHGLLAKGAPGVKCSYLSGLYLCSRDWAGSLKAPCGHQQLRRKGSCAVGLGCQATLAVASSSTYQQGCLRGCKTRVSNVPISLLPLQQQNNFVKRCFSHILHISVISWWCWDFVTSPLFLGVFAPGKGGQGPHGSGLFRYPLAKALRSSAYRKTSYWGLSPSFCDIVIYNKEFVFRLFPCFWHKAP